MATPDTTLDAYASPSDLQLQFDPRQIGDLITFDNTRASPTAINSSPVVIRALNEGAGQIESAALTGQFYTSAILEQIYALPATAATRCLLIELNCNLAFGILWKFRHPNCPADEVPGAIESNEMLNALQTGKRIFSLVENEQAGLPITSPLINPCDPSNLVNQAYRFFGPRNYGYGFGYPITGPFGT